MITPFVVHASHLNPMADAGPLGPSLAQPTGGADLQGLPRPGAAMAPHPNGAMAHGQTRPSNLHNAAFHPYPTPPRTASSASSSGAAAWAGKVNGAMPWFPQAIVFSKMPTQLAEDTAAAAGHAQGPPVLGPNGPVNEQEALFLYGPALRALGLAQSTLEKQVGTPHGPWILAMLSQNLPVLQGCGFTNEALTSAVSQALGPMNMQILGQYGPTLRHLGWSTVDILEVAKTSNGAQGLAELTHFAPSLLSRGYFHHVLASCAQTPGGLAVLMTMQPPVGGAAEHSSLAHSDSPPAEHRHATGRAIVPIEFTAAELEALGRRYRGAERVAALQQFTGRLDSARIDKGAVLALARVPNGDKHLNQAYRLAPAFEELDIGLDRIFAVLMRRDGAKTLKTLLRVSPQLHAFNVNAAMQVSIAARIAGSDLLEVVVQHAADVLALRWTPEQLTCLSCLPGAAKNLLAVRGKAPPLHAMGFSGAQLLGMFYGGHGSEVLSAMIAHAPALLSLGFSLQQVASIAKRKVGGLKLQTLVKFAGTLISHGFGPTFLTQMAIEGEGMVAYKKLFDCCKYTANGLPLEVLFRAASLEGGEMYLATIDRHWMALRATGPDAARALYNALSHQHTASFFEDWVTHYLARSG